MQAGFADEKDIAVWMTLVRRVKDNFPGLETEDDLDAHEQTVLKFMLEHRALWVKDADRAAGILLLSKKHSMICFLAVDPGHRRQGIASLLLEKAITLLGRERDITVSTFREEDSKGTAPRALYRRFGFTEGALTVEFGYPNQVFTLPARPADKAEI